MLLRPPGVYRPQADTALLADVLRRAGVAAGARVLDVGTGTGAVAVAAARCGAREVVAVESRRARCWRRGATRGCGTCRCGCCAATCSRPWRRSGST
ncbi:hypothetical protein BJF79_46660 [Actinomadura sp. CNU-125]|nr:hypothetical protein BJF79_46660 [Actinomadura sp. CNU-125]